MVYIQYQISLTSVSANTPTFQDISIAFTASDTTPPAISLTALSPDPNNDNTPSLTGTATDTVGTVSAVQYQIDGTGGSWTSCTADDGSFNSASEAFTCTASTLADGSHTMYIRATDSNGNTTSDVNASTDTFTIDATAPTSIDLDSPGDNSYTNNERPTFKWKATSDATAGLSKYVLEIDNPSIGSGQPSGDFTIDSIPTSRTTDYETNKYIIHYENFSDSDSTNNYLSVYTKSHSDWGTSENDGKLREGRVSWKVKAVDNAGNETSSSRTLFVDRTGPKVEFTQVNDTPFSSTNFSTTDKTPTIYGKITDPLSGGDSSQTQDENGPKIASGPKQVEIKIEKKEDLGYKLHTLYTINIDKPWYTCDGKEVSDNSKQKCDKYLPFEYTPKDALDFGTYKITLTGKEKADNSSSTSLTLTVASLAEIITPEEKEAIEEKIKELPKEEQKKVKEELEITKPTEAEKPSVLETVGSKIGNALANLWWGLVDTGKSVARVTVQLAQGTIQTAKTTGNTLANAWNGYKNFATSTNQKTLALVKTASSQIASKVGQALTIASAGIASASEAVSKQLEIASSVAKDGLLAMTNNIGQTISNTAKSIGQGYNQLANNAPGVTKTILLGFGKGVTTVTNTTTTIAQNTASTVGNAANLLAKTTGAIAQITAGGVKTAGNAVANAANNVGQGISQTIGAVTGAGKQIAQNIGSTTRNVAKVPIQIASQTVSGVKNTVANTFGSPLAALSDQTNRLVQKTTTYLAITAEYWFDKEPTKILAVNVEKVSATSAVIYWQTNHHATSAVNYGFDTSYGKKVQSSERVKEHRLELAGLEPGKTYFFEVMSQNKNYVYDAYYTFSAPKLEEEKVKGATTGSPFKKPVVEVVGNKNDWIFVRSSPDRSGDVVAKVQVGQTFPFLSEQDGWLLIKFDPSTSSGQAEGWMFGEYGRLTEPQE